MDGLPAVSCTFFNLLNASVCSEDNLAFHTERDSSTLSSHLRCKHIFCAVEFIFGDLASHLDVFRFQIILPLIPTFD